MLNPIHFQELDSLWVPHTVDWFASLNSKQLPHFCAKWLCPGCEGVDPFTLDWRGENNLLVPPVYLIPRVLRHMTHNGESGFLVVPFWPSAPWWPLLLKDSSNFQDFVVACLDIPIHSLTFLPGSADSDLFGNGSPSYRILALRLQCQSVINRRIQKWHSQSPMCVVCMMLCLLTVPELPTCEHAWRLVLAWLGGLYVMDLKYGVTCWPQILTVPWASHYSSGLHHYRSILSSVVGRTHSHYQFPELPTTIVEAWYCYWSADSVIVDLHVFCQLLSVDSQSLLAPWASHYSSGGLVLLLLSGLQHYGSILSTVIGWLTVIFSVSWASHYRSGGLVLLLLSGP